MPKINWFLRDFNVQFFVNSQRLYSFTSSDWNGYVWDVWCKPADWMIKETWKSLQQSDFVDKYEYISLGLPSFIKLVEKAL